MSPQPTILPSFRAGSTFTLGVEEELHVVDPDSLAPLQTAEVPVEWVAATGARATGEISHGMVEFITPVCARAGDAVQVLCALRADGVRRGMALIGAGVHPDARFGAVQHRQGGRYRQIADSMRGVMRQTPHCGVHVHVGMPEQEMVIRACNGMRKWIPLLQALSANSPFWYGHDSGL